MAGVENYLNVDMIPGWSSLTVGKKGFELGLMGYLKKFNESDFDQVYKRSIQTRFDDIPITVIGKEDLIAEKLANARPKDILDVKALQNLNPNVDHGLKVRVLNQNQFEEMIIKNGISPETVRTNSKAMFISIIDSEANPILKDAKNYLTLQFDDVEKNVPGEAITMNENHVSRLQNFIEINKEKSICYIHCTAGVSRSGSIGKYIVDKLNGDMQFFKENNPNIDVKAYFLKRLEKKRAQDMDQGISM